MDTRLRSFRYSGFVKTLLFLMIAGLVTVAFVQVLAMGIGEIPFETIVEPSYKDSNAYMYSVRSGYPEYTQAEWESMRVSSVYMARIFAGALGLAIVLLVYLTVVIGRTEKHGTVQLNWHDRIPSDLMMALYAGSIGIWGLFIELIFNRRLTTQNHFTWAIGSAGVVTFIWICALGVYYLSVVKQLKARKFISSSIVYRVFYKIYDLFRSLMDGRAFRTNSLTQTLFRRQLVFIGMSFGLVFLTFLFLMAPPLIFFTVLAEFILIYWFVKENRKTFAAIDRGFNESLEEQMKSERMKIQLITNVSHDLKTPLTAIISYLDLLEKETLTDEARDYVTILSEKSDRLKHIVSDLFDLAKSTTGNIQVDLEDLDLKRLVEQVMGDLSDEIEGSGLTFKVQLPDAPVMIQSDGNKLYRVIGNVLDNALKYSMAGTRVHVILAQQEEGVSLSVKNIAGYEMNFTEEEILQRFVRGDQARSTEGSGLGLSIAESFTQVCGGEFDLKIDGDLFKVTLKF